MPSPHIQLIGDVQVHPAAQLFPEMGEEELESLKKSISEHGVRVPVTFFDGMLLDGRNRLRAYLALGLPFARLPREGLLPSVDPYAFAWDRNCQRLDYTPDLKAQISMRVLSESGELKRLRDQGEARANALRSEKAKEQPREKAKYSKAKPVGPPGGGQPAGSKVDRRKNATAAKVAAVAGVSQRTVERQMAKGKKGETPARPPAKARPAPATPQATAWVLPSRVDVLAELIRRRLSADQLRELVALLTGGND